MRALALLALIAVPTAALAGDPPKPPGEFHLQTTLDRPAPTPTPCNGRLSRSTALCDVSFRLSTTAAVILLDSLLPVQRRLTPFSGMLPPPGTRTDAPGTWVTGFASDPTFVGLGKFQLRDNR
jgi:hypothetical protein